MGFNSTMSIQVQTWSRVTEVYLSQLSLETRVLPELNAGYNLVHNGEKGFPLQRKF